MRLTPDDKVATYVAYASLLSRERRLKEANRVLSHAKALFAGLPQVCSCCQLVALLSLFLKF